MRMMSLFANVCKVQASNLKGKQNKDSAHDS